MAELLFRVKPRHVEKFQKCRFPDVGKSELEKKKHVQNIRSTVHRMGDLMGLSIPFPFGWLLNKKAARVEVNISLAFLHWVGIALPLTFCL